MAVVYVVRLQKAFGDDFLYGEYTYPRAFRLQSSASDYLREMAKQFEKAGFKEVKREQATPSSPIHNLKLEDGTGERRLLAMCAWDYNDD